MHKEILLQRYPFIFKLKNSISFHFWHQSVSSVIPQMHLADWDSLIVAGTEVIQWEVKKEPQNNFFSSQFDQSSSCSKAGLMSVSLTLNRAAAEVRLFSFSFFK